MPKIPKDTPWTRFKTFLRGLLLYNTIYWQRASDGLRPPRPTRAERRSKRPQRDLTIIKPRENPRAKLAGGEEEAASPPAVVVPAPIVAALTPTPLEPLKKRRKMRKRRRASLADPAHRSGGVFKRIFGRGVE